MDLYFVMLSFHLLCFTVANGKMLLRCNHTGEMFAMSIHFYSPNSVFVIKVSSFFCVFDRGTHFTPSIFAECCNFQQAISSSKFSTYLKVHQTSKKHIYQEFPSEQPSYYLKVQKMLMRSVEFSKFLYFPVSYLLLISVLICK